MNTIEEVNKMLQDYSAERGWSFVISLQDLISSHNSLTKELNNGKRKEWQDALVQARQQAAKQQMDETYIKIDTVRNMSVQEFVNFIGESNV